MNNCLPLNSSADNSSCTTGQRLLQWYGSVRQQNFCQMAESILWRPTNLSVNCSAQKQQAAIRAAAQAILTIEERFWQMAMEAS